MSQQELKQRVAGFILLVSFLAGCSTLGTAPASTHTITPTLTDRPASTSTPTAPPKSSPAPTATPTPDPCTGWWCTVTGVVYADAAESGNELGGAAATLHHASYCSPTRGQYQTTTDLDGTIEFGEVFFHDTDRIWMEVESEGRVSARWDSIDFYCLFCKCFGSPLEILLQAVPGQ